MANGQKSAISERQKVALSKMQENKVAIEAARADLIHESVKIDGRETAVSVMDAIDILEKAE